MSLALVAAGCDGGRGLEPHVLGLIYGVDDRREVHQAQSDEALAAIARASLLAIGPRRELAPAAPSAGGAPFVRVSSPSAETRLGLCPGERFAQQPAFALCSGFVVAAHWALAAEHCLDVIGTSELVAVSGFHEEAPGVIAPIAATQVHNIVEVAARDAHRDVALVRLDGLPLTPVTLSPELPRPGDVVSSANHGMGVPAKLMTGGHVFAVDDTSFVIDLDAFGGASGAPVVDAAGRVAGILTAGATDYTVSEAGCLEANHLPNGNLAADELVEHARTTLDAFCESRHVPELCAVRATGCSWVHAGSGAPGGAILGLVAGLLFVVRRRVWPTERRRSREFVATAPTPRV